MTYTASVEAIRTMISVGFGCITFIRGLLSDDNFEDATLTGAKSDGSSRHDSNQWFHQEKIKRKFSTEADTLLDYLEGGIFDALEKQYLKSFVFAIYLDEKDPNNLVEAYTFSITYQQIEGTDLSAPIMSLATSVSQMGLMDGQDPVSQATTSGRVPTLGEVKRSVRLLIKRLITVCQQLEPLPGKSRLVTPILDPDPLIPDRRFATFKLYYNDNTPQEYEPPHFVAGDAEKDRFFFSTHGVSQPPERCSLGGVRTGRHEVQIEVASICALIPSPDDNNATFTGHTHASNPKSDYSALDNKRKADAEAQLADAERRRIVWDADPPEEDAEGERDPEYESVGMVGRDVPLGVRTEKNGELEIEPIPVLARESVVRHPGGKHVVPELGDPEALEGSQLQEETQLIETQATVIIPTRVSTQDHQRAIENRMDVDRGINTMELEKAMDGDTQMADDTQRDPTERGTESEERELPSSPVPQAIDPALLNLKAVDCDCGVADADCPTYICQGPCARRLHAWCMGFHTAKEAGTSDFSHCLGCAIKAQPWYALLELREQLKLAEALSGLAMYRRTLKLVYERGLPSNPQAMTKLIGCVRQDAVRNLNRMEVEGFVESRTLQSDELGMLTTESTAKPAKGKGKKGNKKKAAKPQPVLVKTTAILKALERYFDPRGDVEQELLKRFRAEHLHPKKPKAANARVQGGNVLVPSSSVNAPSQESHAGPNPNALPPTDMESQTQQETQMVVDQESVSTVSPPTPPVAPTRSPKRKISARSSYGQRKRAKVSLANAAIDLETFE